MWTWLLLTALAGTEPDPARDAYMAAVDRMLAIVDATDAATWTFHKQEWADHALQPRQVMTIKARRAGDIYLRYTGDHNNGREVLYRPAVSPDEILVNPSPLLPTMTFDLDGRVATDGERYTVPNLSLHTTVERYRSDGRLLAARNHAGMAVEDLGRRLVAGEAAQCWRVTLPKDEVPALYAQVVETCVAERTQVVIRIRAWDDEDGQRVCIEDYTWAELQLGVPLTDLDFDPDNPAYRF